MAVKVVKTRKAAAGDSAMPLTRSGSDPMGETLPIEDVPAGGKIDGILRELVECKLELDRLAPPVEAANQRYDQLRKQLDEELVEAGLSSAGTVHFQYRVAATLSSRQTVKVLDRGMVIEYVKKKYPGMLTVNTQTLSAWLKTEAPDKIKEHPESIGCKIEDVPQLQLRITALKG